MKHATLLGAMLTGVLPTAGIAQETTQAQNPEKPNIIFFLVDDMGWQECSVPFYNETRSELNNRYRTPNMERMAKMGMKFTNAYACAVSSPSRCSLMTGMNAARHRVTNWTLDYDSKTDAGGGSLNIPDWNYNGIQPATVTSDKDKKNTTVATPLPQILKDNGYYTIHCGKAHFSARQTTGENPLSFGFDVNIAGGANGGPASYLASNGYGEGQNFHVSGLEKYKGTGTFLTEALTIEALKAVEKPIAENKPFYLYMSHYAIHAPYDPDDRFVGNYRDADGQGKYDTFLNTRLNTQEINHAALVEGMDKSLGDILDFLDRNPEVKKNTIILFMSDNGGQAVSCRQGTWNTQNYPARAGKGSAYEGGIHEPMMVYWPGVTEAGTINANRVMIEDFFPSIIEMAGIRKYKTVQEVDGKSFVDLIQNPSLKRDRTIIWHYPNLWGETQDRTEGYGAYSAIMKGDYHMIYFWETQERRLYNIREDIGEKDNLVANMPELLKELSQELADSLKAYNAQRPTRKDTGAEVPWPDDAVLQAAPEDVVAPSESIFKMSDDKNRYYYSIKDHRDNEGTMPPFFWTLGEHNGYNALQCSNMQDVYKQLFYFTQGSEDNTFHIHTADGRNVDYTEGQASGNWTEVQNGTYGATTCFLQYGTETPGEFQLIKTGHTSYYNLQIGGDLLNDRGTGNGDAANMKWVINTYTGHTFNSNDPGSRYCFTLVSSESEETLEAWKKNILSIIGYVGSYPESCRTEIEAVNTLEEKYLFESTHSKIALQDGGYYFIKTAANQNCQDSYMTYANNGSAIDCVVKMLAEGETLEAKHVWKLKFNDKKTGYDYYRVLSCNNQGTQGYGLNFAKETGVSGEGCLKDNTGWRYRFDDMGNGQFKFLTGEGSRIIRTENNGVVAYHTSLNFDATWYIIPAKALNVKFDESGYATTYLPFDATPSEGMKAYTVNTVSSNAAYLEEKKDIPANSAAILRGNAGETYQLNIRSAATSNWTGNLLLGSTTDIYVQGDAYALANKDNKVALYKVLLNTDANGAAGTTHFKNNANQAYLPASIVPQGAQLLIFNFGTDTGISSINGTEDTGIVYDLSGRRVQDTPKGVYVSNGKKIAR